MFHTVNKISITTFLKFTEIEIKNHRCASEVVTLLLYFMALCFYRYHGNLLRALALKNFQEPVFILDRNYGIQAISSVQY